jgi:hypothetical protein
MCAKVLFVSNTNPAISCFGAEQRSSNLLKALLNGKQFLYYRAEFMLTNF